jgi:Leucine-rich repeat (LRR) protein
MPSSSDRVYSESSGRPSRSRIVRLTVLAAASLLCIAAIRLAIGLHRARLQRETIAAITKDGGDVSYAYQWDFESTLDHLRPDAEPRPWVPKFLRRVLGDDFFYDVVSVELHIGGDAAVGKLRLWRNLKSLNINHFSITDQGMEYAAEFPDLEVLWLGDSPDITPAGFRCLKRLPRLREINMWGCPIHDADLVNLSGATGLLSLTLGRTPVSGSGLARLNAPQLDTLVLDDSPVTDKGLAGVEGLPEITWLCLNGTRITDEGLLALGKMHLHHLELERTNVTGTGLKYLRGSKALQELCFGQARVTDDGLAAIGEFSHLRDLFLSSNRFTDAGLPGLNRLVELNMLSLNDNHLSRSALEELQRHLKPGVVIPIPAATVAGGKMKANRKMDDHPDKENHP